MSFETTKVIYDLHPSGEFSRRLEFPIGATSLPVSRYDDAVIAFAEELNDQQAGTVEYILKTLDGTEVPQSAFWEA